MALCLPELDLGSGPYRRREAVSIDDPPVEQRRRPEDEQARVDDIRQEMATLGNPNEADDSAKSQCRGNAAAARKPPRQ